METREIYDRQRFGQYVWAARRLGLMARYERALPDRRVLTLRNGKRVTFSVLIWRDVPALDARPAPKRARGGVPA
jgi:hypothetical protein